MAHFYKEDVARYGSLILEESYYYVKPRTGQVKLVMPELRLL